LEVVSETTEAVKPIPAERIKVYKPSSGRCSMYEFKKLNVANHGKCLDHMGVYIT
jgi:hypothetical protein